jgi:hypothetical protein
VSAPEAQRDKDDAEKLSPAPEARHDKDDAEKLHHSGVDDIMES